MSQEENDIMKDLVNITTLNGENIIDILTSESPNVIDEYVWSWKERIKEEHERRIKTGIVTPIKVLPWCIRGIGWETLFMGEVPF